MLRHVHTLPCHVPLDGPRTILLLVLEVCSFKCPWVETCRLIPGMIGKALKAAWVYACVVDFLLCGINLLATFTVVDVLHNHIATTGAPFCGKIKVLKTVEIQAQNIYTV